MKYECGVCGIDGVKLWRLYQTFLEHQELTCAKCSCDKENIIDTVDSLGMIKRKYGKSDQIGWRVPAVPTDDETFWGYTSVPQDKVDWWKALPTRY